MPVERSVRGEGQLVAGYLKVIWLQRAALYGWATSCGPTRRVEGLTDEVGCGIRRWSQDMPDRLSSFYLLFPGAWTSVSEVTGHLARHSVAIVTDDTQQPAPGSAAVQLVHEPAGFGNAALWGPPGRLSAEAIAQVSAFRNAALIEVNACLDQATGICATIGRAMLQANGVLVRMEGSGLASEIQNWIRSMESKETRDLVRTSVVFTGAGDSTFHTVGMNQFDRPDVEIRGVAEQEALHWLYEFCVYCLDEDPALTSGHTFRPDTDTPRRTIARWPELRHSDQDGRYNKFGVWVATLAAADSLRPLEPVPVPIPALIAVLLAAERTKGGPLARSEVESVVDAAPSIAMAARDVQALERSRGYVDLEPRLAWEQWRAVRERFV
jgi:hypothetical protein